MSTPLDAILAYQFLKKLTTPFTETRAYALGLIDRNGKTIRSASTPEELAAFGYFDRIVFNLKKLLEKLPGGKSRYATYATALFLIKEDQTLIDSTKFEIEIARQLHKMRAINLPEITDVRYFIESVNKISQLGDSQLIYILEDVPVNSAGAGSVAGIVGDPPVKKKRIGTLLRRRKVK